MFGELRRLGQVPWQDCSLMEKLLIPSSLWMSAVALEAIHKPVDRRPERLVDTDSRLEPGLCLG